MIKCTTCGANVNIGLDNQRTCDFCGNVQYVTTISYPTESHETIIPFKPEIRAPRFYTEKTAPLNSDWYRVDGGIKNIDTGLFVADKERQEGYYTLIVKNKGVSSLDEIFDWFSETELNKIEELDVSNNKLTDISKALELKSLKILRASNNQIAELPRIDFIEETEQTKKVKEAAKYLSIDVKPLNKEYIEIDLSNNKITSYSNFYYLRVDRLLLSGNQINKIDEIICYPRIIDLSSNLIEDISSLQNLVNKSILKKYFNSHLIVLNNNPIQNVEKINNIHFIGLTINEYDNKIYDTENIFENVRKNGAYLSDISFKEIFDILNSREFYVCLEEVSPTIKHIEVSPNSLPGKFDKFKKNGNKFILLKQEREYLWADVLAYFGYKEKSKSTGGCLGVLATIILFIVFFYSL